MDFKKYQTLIINGQKLHGHAIIQYCSKSLVRNLNQMAAFIEDWLNDCPTIEVKTSGSTGKPKSIWVEKNAMIQSASMSAEYFHFAPGQAALLCLPMQYIAGKMMVVRALFSSLNLICIEPSGNPLNEIPKEKTIDFVPLVPLQLENAGYTDNIKRILLGGAPVNNKLQEKIRSLSSEVFLSYGMTETLTHVAIRRLNGSQRSEYFHALPGVTFHINEHNCLIIQTPVLNHEIHTHDVVELSNPKEFKWLGRWDNVINSGGVKLHPEEIEGKIAAFIDKNYFVFGIKDEKLGRKICLFVEDSPPPESGKSDLIKRLEPHLEKFELPKEVFFIPSFLYTTSGKIKRLATVQRFFGKTI